MTEFEVMRERLAQAQEPGRTSAFRRTVLREAEAYLCELREITRQMIAAQALGGLNAAVEFGVDLQRAAELTNPQLQPD